MDPQGGEGADLATVPNTDSTAARSLSDERNCRVAGFDPMRALPFTGSSFSPPSTSRWVMPPYCARSAASLEKGRLTPPATPSAAFDPDCTEAAKLSPSALPNASVAMRMI
jgi:hypothetical protein